MADVVPLMIPALFHGVAALPGSFPLWCLGTVAWFGVLLYARRRMATIRLAAIFGVASSVLLTVVAWCDRSGAPPWYLLGYGLVVALAYCVVARTWATDEYASNGILKGLLLMQSPVFLASFLIHASR